MKSRALWAFVALAALTLAAAYWWRNKTPPLAPAPSVASTVAKPTVAAPSSAPSAVVTPSATIPTAPAPTVTAATVAAAPTSTAEKKPKPEVAIQEGKTIDFSSGVAVVKDDAQQKAAIDKAVKEMDSALQGVTFAPVEQAKAEPTPAAPKP